eukprot:COSAG01_NODE_1171_length_11401_cov_6.099186_6_plen_163_part_00
MAVAEPARSEVVRCLPLCVHHMMMVVAPHKLGAAEGELAMPAAEQAQPAAAAAESKPSQPTPLSAAQDKHHQDDSARQQGHQQQAQELHGGPPARNNNAGGGSPSSCIIVVDGAAQQPCTHSRCARSPSSLLIARHHQYPGMQTASQSQLTIVNHIMIVNHT